jgi:hypothetical protein
MIRTIFFLTRQSDTGKLSLVDTDQEVLPEVNGDPEGSRFGARRLWETQSVPSSDGEESEFFMIEDADGVIHHHL